MKLSGTTFHIVAIAALAIVPVLPLGLVAEAGTSAATPTVAAPAQVRYVCPMGEFEGDRPGRCPKCGMKLVEKKAVEAPAAAGKATGSMAAGHKCDHAMAAGHKCDHAMAAGHNCDHAKAAGHKCDQATAAGHNCNHGAGANGASGSVSADQEAGPASAKASTPAAETVRYACPMGCHTGDKPGTCPKCGMKLVKQK